MKPETQSKVCPTFELPRDSTCSLSFIFQMKVEPTQSAENVYERVTISFGFFFCLDDKVAQIL